MFFPWVPPHVHFMAWYNGRPIDPFLAHGEKERPGIWNNKNPKPMNKNTKEAIPKLSSVNKKAVDEIVSACTDKKIKEELMLATGNYPTLAAILEDALHHDDFAWPSKYHGRTVRPKTKPSSIKLSLPLPRYLYRGAIASDLRR